MPKINPEHINALLNMINRSSYYMLLSMRVCNIDVGYSKVVLDLKKDHINPFGTVHGGVYASIIDTAAYWAAYCELDEDAGFTTIDLTVNNLSMAKDNVIIAEGKSIKIGKSTCLTEATAKDNSGKLLAHGTSKLMVLQGKQSISHAIEAMEHCALPLKFIE